MASVKYIHPVTLTYAELKDKTVQVLKRNNTAKVKALLARYNAIRLADLKPHQYYQVFYKLHNL